MTTRSLALLVFVTCLATGSMVTHSHSLASATQGPCVDDVRIEVWDPADPNNNYYLKDPPNYSGDDEIRIYYDVYNDSCTEVGLRVDLVGSESGATILNAEMTPDPCLKSCRVSAEGYYPGNVRWDLAKHPPTDNERVVARVTVVSPEDFADANEANNSATSLAGINIVTPGADPPAEPRRHVSITSIVSSHGEAPVGTTIEFTVGLTNDGEQSESPSVVLSIDDADTIVDSSDSEPLASGESATLTLHWDTSDYTAGVHDVVAHVVADDDASLGEHESSIQVTLREPIVDLRIIDIASSHLSAPAGQSVDFAITVANHGDFDTVPFLQLSWEDGGSVAGPFVGDAIPPGATRTTNVVWDTAQLDGGSYELLVSIRPGDAAAEVVHTATSRVVLHDPVDVAITSAAETDPPAIIGEPVAIETTITNRGQHTAEQLAVSLYVDAGTDPVASASLDSLASGDSATVELLWDTYGLMSGQYGLTVSVVAAGDIGATDNTGRITVVLQNWIKLGEVTPRHTVGITGDIIQTAVEVSNHGPDALDDLTVGLYGRYDTNPIASKTITTIRPNQTETVILEWDTDGEPVDTHNLHVFVESDAFESDVDDVKPVSVTLRNPISLSDAAQIPLDAFAGSPVAIVARLTNRSGKPIPEATVELVAVASGENVASVHVANVPARESVTVSVEWDTSGAGVGSHKFLVVASLPTTASDDDDSIQINVFLRQPVVEVALVDLIASNDIAVIGQPITYTVTVANRGEYSASVPVSLFVDHSADPKVVADTGEIAAGQSGAVEIIWDTTKFVAGPRVVRIELGGDGDASAENHAYSLIATLFHPALAADNQQSECADDVSVEVLQVADDDGTNRQPPVYSVLDRLTVSYSISNFSCATDASIELSLTGSVSGVAIVDEVDPCLYGCKIPAGGMFTHAVSWRLLHHPVVEGEHVDARVTVGSPAGFADFNPANNTSHSSQSVNVTALTDVHVKAYQHDANRGHILGTMALSEFSASYGKRGTDSAIAHLTVTPTGLVIGSQARFSVRVVNSGNTSAEIPVALYLDGQPGAIAGDRTAMLEPGAAGLVHFIWRVPASLTPGEHTLSATVADPLLFEPERNTITKSVQLIERDGEITIVGAFVWPQHALVGNTITVQAAVRNDGTVPETPDVGLFLGSSRIAVAHAVPQPITPGGIAYATLVWDSPIEAPPRRYFLRVSVDGMDEWLAVRLLSPETSVSLRNLKASTPVIIAGETEEVTFRAVLENTGDTAALTSASLFLDGESDPVAVVTPVSILPGATSGIDLIWRVPHDIVLGNRELSVRVKFPVQTTTETVSGSVPIKVRGPYSDHELFNIVADPAPAFAGETVVIHVSVLNPTVTRKTIPITLRFPGEDRQEERRTPGVNPHETIVRRFQWRTGNLAPGSYTLRTSAEIHGRTLTAESIIVLQRDAEIVSATSDPIATAVRGQPVEISVEVRNNGRGATNVPIELTFPSKDKSPETRSPYTAAGSSEKVVFTWRTGDYATGDHTLHLRLAGIGNVTDGDTFADVQIRLILPPFEVTLVDIATSPSAPMVGTPVEISIGVHNGGPVGVSAPIELHFPSPDKQPETRRPYVRAGETKYATFTWRTTRYEPGSHTFRVVVGDAESSGSQNISRTFDIHLLPPVADFAVDEIRAVELDRPFVQGDWISVTARVRNLGPATGRGIVALRDLTHDADMYERTVTLEADEARTVEFTWKTLRYGPGDHILATVVRSQHDPDGRNDVAGPALVSVLSNRDLIISYGGQIVDSMIVTMSDKPRLPQAAESPADPVKQPAPLDRAMYALYRAALASEYRCMELQKLLGNSQPRSVLCPYAPPLAR